MLRIRNILFATSFLLLAVLAVMLWRVKEKQDYSQKVILAKETRKVMGQLMVDLRGAASKSINGAPADGRWYDRFAFDRSTIAVEYSLKQGFLSRLSEGNRMPVAQHIASVRMRRQPNEASVVEVQIKAHQNLSSLVSNFKIRLQD